MSPVAQSPTDLAELAVRHDIAGRRFVASVDGLDCEACYDMHDGVMWIVHTAVPPRLQGRGVAARVVAGALAFARASGLKVQPSCSYVRAHMRRHPETLDLLVSR